MLEKTICICCFIIELSRLLKIQDARNNVQRNGGARDYEFFSAVMDYLMKNDGKIREESSPQTINRYKTMIVEGFNNLNKEITFDGFNQRTTYKAISIILYGIYLQMNSSDIIDAFKRSGEIRDMISNRGKVCRTMFREIEKLW